MKQVNVLIKRKGKRNVKTICYSGDNRSISVSHVTPRFNCKTKG